MLSPNPGQAGARNVRQVRILNRLPLLRLKRFRDIVRVEFSSRAHTVAEARMTSLDLKPQPSKPVQLAIARQLRHCPNWIIQGAPKRFGCIGRRQIPNLVSVKFSKL